MIVLKDVQEVPQMRVTVSVELIGSADEFNVDAEVFYVNVMAGQRLVEHAAQALVTAMTENPK